MHSLVPFHLFLTILDFAALSCYAIRVPLDINVRNASPGSLALGRRAPVPVGNTGNAQYSANMTIGGVQVRVLLDTGSSDLWVNFPNQTPNTVDSGKSLTLEYAIGKASGNAHSTQVQFGNFSLDNQAFLLVTDTSTFTTDIHSQGYDGLFGLGNNDGSVIHKKLGSSYDTFLNRIFSLDKQTNNYITLLLDRKFDPAATYQGQLTISELVPGYESISNMTKLDVDKVNRLLKGDQHWQALTDKDNAIIGPDGQPLRIKSVVPSAPSGQLVAVFDSGFTFSQVPRDLADAIYGRVQGAEYDTNYQYWTVPCGQYLNISFNFGGANYPVHPLDTVDNNFHITNPSGNPACIGAFQPITTAFSMLGHYDMILGMNFLRNAYTLLDYGDWTQSSSNSRGKPYIQLLSLTNVQKAKQDFVQVRLSGQDTTSDSRWALLPASQMQHSPVSEAEKKRKYQEYILSRWPYIFIGCVIFVTLLLGFCIWKCCCRRGQDGRRHCICCGGRGRKDRPGQIEKGGANSRVDLPNGMPSSPHGRTKGEDIPSVYIPLEDQPGYGHPDAKSALAAYDDYARSYSTQSMPSPPPAAYGSGYDEDRHHSNASPYYSQTQAAHQYGHYDDSQATYASQSHLVPGGFYPPGLAPAQSRGAHYVDPAYGHPPNGAYAS